MALTGFVEPLRVAADSGDSSRPINCSWQIMYPGGNPVSASCGLSVSPDSDLLPPDNFDYVAVIGGLLNAQQNLKPELFQYLKQAAQLRVPIIGACTGSFTLARAGLMEGYRCCVHHFHEDTFETEFPSVETINDQLYIIDRDRITCPGGGSVLDLAVHLIGVHLGPDSAAKVMEYFLFDEARKGSHPQAHFVTSWSRSVGSPLVQRAILLMQQQMINPRSIQEIASRLGVSSKKLDREFQNHLSLTPKDFYIRIRLDRALWFLQRSGHSILSIATQCGFYDASHFSRSFKRYFGVTPIEARKKLKQDQGTIKNLAYGANLQSELMSQPPGSAPE